MTPAIFGLSGLVLTSDERRFFQDADPVGYILFGRNVQTRGQLRRLTDQLRAIHGRAALFICIDQEGGRVARMRPPEWPAYPPGEAFDRLYDLAPISAIAAARANAHALGIDLADAGITVDCAPLLDVRVGHGHDVIGDRALGSEPLRVAALGRAVLDGLRAAGVAGVIKHLPGHGRAQADSHRELPTVTASPAELERDLAPFCALAGPGDHAAIAMTGHIRFTAWDRDNPATLSPFIIQTIIRQAIGFGGLLLTDDIDMAALTGTIAQRSARAIAAGCDVVLNCWARMDDMIAMADILPPLTTPGSQRLHRALTIAPPPATPGDQARLVATRDGLLALPEAARE